MNCPATAAVAPPSDHSRCMPSSLVNGRMTACAIKAWRSARRLGRDGFMRQKMRSFQRLAMNVIKGRNAIVPFEQRCSPTHARYGVRIKFPNWIEHGMIVRVQNVFLEFRMPREMNLRDAIARHSIDINLRIEAVIF